MTPEEAVSAGAREALEILDRMRQAGVDPDAASILGALAAAQGGTRLLAGALKAEVGQPGVMRSMDAGERQHLLRQAQSAAAGYLLAFALCPGVDELPAPVLQ